MLKNNKGMAALEVIAIFAVIMILFNFSLGFYGVIQTGILKNMAARNYALETFRFRSNLDFFWRAQDRGDGLSKFRTFGNRLHGITSEFSNNDDKWMATARPISFVATFGGTAEDGIDYSKVIGKDSGMQMHNQTVYQIKDDGKPLLADKDKYRAYPVWIKSVYGICINFDCSPR